MMRFLLKSLLVNFLPISMLVGAMFINHWISLPMVVVGNILMLAPMEGPSYGSRIGRKLFKMDPTSHWPL